jgi:hypothetical protein
VNGAVANRLLAWSRAARGPAIVLLSYLLARLAFAALTEDGGLVTPEGKPSLGVAGLGVVVLVLRIAVLFGIPALIAYRAVTHILEPAKSDRAR